MMERKCLAPPNNHNGCSPTWPLLCTRPFGTSSDAASHKHSSHKTKVVPLCDFHVSFAFSKYPDHFHLCGLDVDATKNSNELLDTWILDYETIDTEPITLDP